MQIQTNYANVPSSPALEEQTREELESAVGRFIERVSRVEVYYADLNGPEKGGPDDKQCRLEARPKGLDPLLVEGQGDTFYEALNDASQKLKRVLAKRLERD